MSKETTELQADGIEKRRIEILNLVGSLYRSEQDGGQHKFSSIEPTRSSLSDMKQASIDALARVLTGPDVCAAVCFDGGEILVANNTGNDVYAKQQLFAFQQFANSPSKKTYEKLNEIANQESIRILRNLKVQEAGKLKQSKEAAGSNIASSEFLSALSRITEIQEISALYESAKAVIRDQSTPAEVRNLASDILRPLVDVRTVANAIIMGGLEPEVVEAIKRYETNTEFVPGERGEHAEMKIKQRLKGKGKLEGSKKYPIGIAKLACCPCSVSIGLSSNLEITGTHGGTYPGWQPPACDLEDDELLKALDRVAKGGIKYDKVREVPNLTPEDLGVRPPLLARKTPEELRDIKGILDKIDLKTIELKRIEGQKVAKAKLAEPLERISKEILELRSEIEQTTTSLQREGSKLDEAQKPSSQQPAPKVKSKQQHPAPKDRSGEKQRNIKLLSNAIEKLNEKLVDLQDSLKSAIDKQQRVEKQLEAAQANKEQKDRASGTSETATQGSTEQQIREDLNKLESELRKHKLNERDYAQMDASLRYISRIESITVGSETAYVSKPADIPRSSPSSSFSTSEFSSSSSSSSPPMQFSTSSPGSATLALDQQLPISASSPSLGTTRSKDRSMPSQPSSSSSSIPPVQLEASPYSSASQHTPNVEDEVRSMRKHFSEPALSDIRGAGTTARGMGRGQQHGLGRGGR